mmetsp:Transcript_5822/g.12782  ORF Transcript_5822/g.12782 Transcript_5822/m.12782 type:complete len:219 (-) Transcript_5822:350-1006(-)
MSLCHFLLWYYLHRRTTHVDLVIENLAFFESDNHLVHVLMGKFEQQQYAVVQTNDLVEALLQFLLGGSCILLLLLIVIITAATFCILILVTALVFVFLLLLVGQTTRHQVIEGEHFFAFATYGNTLIAKHGGRVMGAAGCSARQASFRFPLFFPTFHKLFEPWHGLGNLIRLRTKVGGYCGGKGGGFFLFFLIGQEAVGAGLVVNIVGANALFLTGHF